MRAFIAIELPENIKKTLTKIQKEIEDECCKVNWVKPEHQHLTLKFLGDVPEDKIEIIKERLKTIAFKPFELKLTSLGVFPNENYIRVIWVGLDGKVKELQQEIDSKLADLFPKDQRFHSHITLGRVKFVKAKEKLKEKLNIKVEGRFKVENFKLLKSELTREGPIYEELAIFS